MRKFVVIDTNIIVAGLITADIDSPTARILNSMLKGEVPYLLSEELLSEYVAVLYRPKLAKLHQLTNTGIDTLLADIVVNAAWREPATLEVAPDQGDNHLWRLLGSEHGSILVTGDQLLQSNPPVGHSVISPRKYVDILNRDTVHEPAGSYQYRPARLE